MPSQLTHCCPHQELSTTPPATLPASPQALLCQQRSHLQHKPDEHGAHHCPAQDVAKVQLANLLRWGGGARSEFAPKGLSIIYKSTADGNSPPALKINSMCIGPLSTESRRGRPSTAPLDIPPAAALNSTPHPPAGAAGPARS